MIQRTFSVALVIAVLLLSSGLTAAAENKTDVQAEAASNVKVSPKNAKVVADEKHKDVAKIKLVDINSASKEELMKLPGVSAAAADKIIAGRPFGSKMWLVSNRILPEPTFQAIRKQLVCKITKKDFDTIMVQAHKNKK